VRIIAAGGGLHAPSTQVGLHSADDQVSATALSTERLPSAAREPAHTCHSSQVTLAEILRGALARATADGLLGVKRRHLTEPELDALLHYCLDFLWEQRTEPSPIDGWWYSAGGIRPWWERAADLDEREALSLRPLRTEVYDLLEERGLIVKGPGNNVPIHVAPPERRGAGMEVVEVISVTSKGAGFGNAIAAESMEKSRRARAEHEERLAALTGTPAGEMFWSREYTREEADRRDALIDWWRDEYHPEQDEVRAARHRLQSLRPVRDGPRSRRGGTAVVTALLAAAALLLLAASLTADAYTLTRSPRTTPTP
jgi:hypothetical protein